MTGTNNYLPFAQGGSANVISQATYAALTAILANGFSAGIAQSDQLNKVWRQSAAISAMIGSFIAAQGYNALDDGNAATLLTAFENALTTYLASSGSRTKLIANATLYIATTGNDSTGDGTIGNPWLTRQKAWNYIMQNLDLNVIYTVTVQMEDTGSTTTYTDVFAPSGTAVGQIAASQVVFQGNSGTPARVVVAPTSGPAWIMSNGLGYRIRNHVYQSSAADGILATGKGTIETVDGITVGACAGAQFLASVGGRIQVYNNLTINGGAVTHMQSQDGGSYIGHNGGLTHTLVGTPAYSGPFANTALLGEIFLTATVPFWSGAAGGAGSKYSATGNSVLSTAGSGAGYFPGTNAGTFGTGGLYV